MSRIEPSDSDDPLIDVDEEKDIWEAKEILREKRGKVYVSWVGQDADGRPYPSTWEPRKHCNEALLAEWDAKQARKKETDGRRKSGGGDKPSSTARAGAAVKGGQKRKRESLPAPSTAAASGSSIKKARRRTTANARRASLPEGGDTSVSSSVQPLAKRKSMSALRVVSDSDTSDEVTFIAVGSAQAPPAADASSKGKEREAPADKPGDVTATTALSTEPAIRPSSTQRPSTGDGPEPPPPAISSSQAAAARPPASPQFRRINQSTSNSSVGVSASEASRPSAVLPGPPAPKRVFMPISSQSSSTSAVPGPMAPPRRASPSAPALTQARMSVAASSQASTHSAAASTQGSQSQPVAPSATAATRDRPSSGGRVADDDEDDAMVEDALDPAKPSAPSSTIVAVESAKTPKLSSLSAFPSSSSAWDAIGSSMRPRLTAPAQKADSDADSEAEDLDDQEVVSLPGPSGDMDEGVRRLRALSPAAKRYLEAIAHNKTIRIENASLREQLTALRNVQAQEAADKAELELTKSELAKERSTHATTRRSLRSAEQELADLTKELDQSRTKLRDASATESFLRDQYLTASDAAQKRAVEAIELETTVQRLQKQLTQGVAQVKAFYAAQIGTHDGVVDTLRAQVELLQKQHQRTGDEVRDKAALVPGLEREVTSMRRRIADLRESLAEAQEDRDLAEAAVERLEDEQRQRGALRQAYAPETDSDDSDAEYRPPGSTPAPIAHSQPPVLPDSEDSSDEENPLSQLVQRDQAAPGSADGPSLGETTDLDAALPPLPPFQSQSPSPSSSLIEMPQAFEVSQAFERAGQYHAGRLASQGGLAPLADLHPSPNSAFGSQAGVVLDFDDDQVFPAGTISLQGLERA